MKYSGDNPITIIEEKGNYIVLYGVIHEKGGIRLHISDRELNNIKNAPSSKHDRRFTDDKQLISDFVNKRCAKLLKELRE